MLYQNIPDTPYATVVVVRDSGMLAQAAAAPASM